MKSFFRITGYSLAFILFLLTLLAGFTQTKIFKDRLRVLIASFITTQTGGSLTLGTIHGNFLNGFAIDSLILHVGGEQFIRTGTISVAYNLLKLPRNSLTIDSLTIDNPQIALLRGDDGVWNISKLAPPSTEEKEASPFNWTIDLRRFRITNARIILKDYYGLNAPDHQQALPHQIEYHDLQLTDLNLNLSVRLQPGEARLLIDRLTFRSDTPDFHLKEFKGEFTAGDKGATVRNLLLITDRSRISLNAAMLGINLFENLSLKEFEHKPVRLRLLADNIDLNELKSFIHQIDFLNGTAFVDLEAGGQFGHLTIERLGVQTYNTSLKITGALDNLHRPEELVINATFEDGKLTPPDANRLLPPFGIPKFDQVGELNVRGQFVGKPLNFLAKVSVSGEIGQAEAEARLNLEGSEMQYETVFATQRFDLARIFGEPALEGSFTTRGDIRGSGTTLNTITAAGEIQIDTSIWNGFPISTSSISIKATPHQLEGTVILASPSMRAAASGAITFEPQENKTINIESTFGDLDLGKILNDPRFSSKISAGATLEASGRTFDDMLGNASIRFGPSTFGTHHFEDEELMVRLEQTENNQRRLVASSSTADLRVEGQFTPLALISSLSHESSLLTDAIRSRFPHPDTGFVPVTQHQTEKVRINRPVDVNFEATVKDLKSAAIFLGGVPFNARGMASGTFAATTRATTFSINARADELFFGTIEKGTLIEGAQLTATLNHALSDYSSNPFDGLTIAILAHVDSILAGQRKLDNVMSHFTFHNREGRFSARTRIDSALSISTTGRLDANEDAIAVAIDTLQVVLGSLMWHNTDPANLHISRKGVSLEDFGLARNNESITMHGGLGSDGRIHGSVQGDSLELALFAELASASSSENGNGSISGLINFKGNLGGTLNEPQLEIEIACSGLTARGKPVGALSGQLHYANREMATDIKIWKTDTRTNGDPYFIVGGTLPIDLGLGEVERRFPDKPMNLKLKSDGLPLEIIDPFLESFDEVSGIFRADIKIGGTPSTPRYLGTLSLDDVAFLFRPNNLPYRLTGTLQAEDDKVRFVDVAVMNHPRDRSDGRMNIGGTITIKDFEIERFDLTATGQLLVLSPATRRSVESVHGTLLVAIGDQGLRFSGSFDDSYLNGSLFVREASLVFPPTASGAYITGGAMIDHVVVDDTSKAITRKKFTEQFYAAGDAQAPTTSTKAQRTVWEGLRYDVAIETRGKTEIRMVFTQATSEELFAELEGKVVLQRSEEGPRLTGEIAISERSYYNFFKHFDAKGTLKFVGPPDDPELKVKAVFKGRRRPPTADKDTVVTEQIVIVTLDISGTRYEPNLKMSMTVDDRDWVNEAQGGDIQMDAISFILTGKFASDLTSREKSDIVTNLGSAAGSSLLYGLPAQMLSGVLTDFLRNEFSFIRSAEVTYQGGSLQETADLRLSGEMFRAYWRFGGRIFNDIGNANVSLALSMGEIFSAPSLRNLFIELERKVEGTDTVEQKKLTNGARIYYKFSF